LFTSFHFSKCVLDAGNLPVEALPFPPKPAEVSHQRPGVVGLAGQYVADDRNSQTEIPKEQDALQPHEAALVVVAITVCADPARLQQPNVPVVPQGARGRSGQPSDFGDRPLHFASTFRRFHDKH
jgi:hypothetical protein